jgi:hypothetical protein
MLVDVPRLMTADYVRRPDVTVPEQRVAFGTSGHRGSAFDCAFNEEHILTILDEEVAMRVLKTLVPLLERTDILDVGESVRVAHIVLRIRDFDSRFHWIQGYRGSPVQHRLHAGLMVSRRGRATRRPRRVG